MIFPSLSFLFAKLLFENLQGLYYLMKIVEKNNLNIH